LPPDEKDESTCPEKYGRGEQREMVERESKYLNLEDFPELWAIPFGLYGDASPPPIQQRPMG